MKRIVTTLPMGGWFVGVLLCVFALSLGFVTTAKAMPTAEQLEEMKQKMEAMSPEEKEQFIKEMKQKGAQQTKPQKNKINAEAGKQEIDQEAEKETQKARFSFERNQMRLRVARNLISSTVAQLNLEGTELGNLPEHVKVLEEKMDEIENIYKDYVERLDLFQNQQGEHPGKIEEVFASAKEKKESLLEFYRDTFRASLEEALTKNEEAKAVN